MLRGDTLSVGGLSLQSRDTSLLSGTAMDSGTLEKTRMDEVGEMSMGEEQIPAPSRFIYSACISEKAERIRIYIYINLSISIPYSNSCESQS